MTFMNVNDHFSSSHNNVDNPKNRSNGVTKVLKMYDVYIVKVPI